MMAVESESLEPMEELHIDSDQAITVTLTYGRAEMGFGAELPLGFP